MTTQLLEAKIRQDGYHPDALSDTAFQALVPPLEMLSMSMSDRIGLRLDFALHRYMTRYLRGGLGSDDTYGQRVLLLRLATLFVYQVSASLFSGSPPALCRWYIEWCRTRLKPADARLDAVLYSGVQLWELDPDKLDEYEPALTCALQGIAAGGFGIDSNRYVEKLREGQGMHTAGVARPQAVGAADREDAALAVPDQGIGAAEYFAFLERGVPDQPSVLYFSDEGVAPDPLRVKTRLDSYGGRASKCEWEVPMPEDRPEPVDESAAEAAEIRIQAQEVRAVLERIRDGEHPGSARHLVAEHMLAGDARSLRALAKDRGRAFEGIRRAHAEIVEEISRIV